tara:strand:- start:58 stop:303 length:246 start_codon:yes stop_codon:yes gene_type:complete
MHYLIIGKEDLNDNSFNYYFEGNFTTDELKSKAKESYCSEYEINAIGETVTKESGTPLTAEGNFNFSFSYIFKSETSITDY